MKIAFFEIQDWEKNYLNKKLKGHDLKFFDKPLSLGSLAIDNNFDIISTFIYSKIDGRIIQNLPNLKLITTRSTGFDHIDLKECAKKKITVCSVPYYGENTIAEHTFALILSLSRNIHKAYVRTLRQDYSIEGLKGFDLKGKTIGVIGAGNIGLHVIRAAKSFGMDVLAYDVNQNNFLTEVLGFNYVTLNELFRKSDIITLHVPYNEFTHHLINKDTIKLIKKGAILINTSRGTVVDTEALIEALDKKILAGAGLDVLEGEELIKEEKQLLSDPKKAEVFGQIIRDHILLNKDNVVFTPHIAFYSQEALERILDTTVENITGFMAEKPQNIVKY
jgi:D-lactate dehydrogenase